MFCLTNMAEGQIIYSKYDGNKIKYSTSLYIVGGQGNGRHKIMSTPVNCDMYSRNTKMLRVSVKRIKEDRRKQL